MTLLRPLTRSTRRRPDPTDPGYPAFLLRTNPVLLLPDPPAEADPVDRLLREWNPLAALPEVAEGVRWLGPFRLDDAPATAAGSLGTVSCAAADLPSGWCTAYAAQTPRNRTRVPDGLDAGLQRLRYPHGLPAGSEAVAWSLIMGLARRLDGAGRLPAASPRRPHGTQPATAQRALAQENSYCVYGNQALPWTALRSVLCLSLPELDRNGSLAEDDYCLDRPGAFEVRVQPFRRDDFVPYALRPHTAADWPGAVYRFRCLPQQSELAAQRVDVQLRAAACLLADVVGGVLLDGDGFPLVGARSAAR